MSSVRTINRFPFLLVLIASLCTESNSQAQSALQAEPSDGPNISGLEQLQRQLIEIIPKLHPAVVSVDGASGVLISRDGLILCQAHVSHRNGRKPGDECDVSLADGTRTKARLLGADRIYDISLLKVVDPGPFPFSTANADVHLQLGEPVLKLGHPQGYKANRPAVVRLGRVLFAGKHRGVTDCLIEGGDSGGPYFDLSGNLIGIVCSSHVPDEIKANSLQLRLVLPMSYTSITVIGERIVELSAGTTTPFDMEKYRQVFDAEYARPKLIKDEEWTQGQSSLALWNTVAAKVAENVVQIEWKGRRLAMGTATGAGGLVLTKASQITSSPDVRLSKDRVLSARVVGVNPAYDLALLKVDGLRCPPLTWSKQLDPAAGTLLMAPSNTGVPIAAGIVSVPRRNVFCRIVSGSNLTSAPSGREAGLRTRGHYRWDPQGRFPNHVGM
jgi:S1-C subfamily serine protease